MDMRLVSLSTDIRNSQQLSTETSNLLQQRLNDIEHRIALVSDGQEQGLQELSDLFASCRSALQNAQPSTASSSNCSSADICPSVDGESEHVNKDTEVSHKNSKRQVSPQKESTLSGPIDVSAKYSALFHLTFHQMMPFCNASCQCVCHSRNRSWQVRYGTSALFKLVFGSFFMGYSGVPTPKITCDVSTCPGPAPESTITVRYTFPTWVPNRAIILAFYSHSNIRHFGMRITRRIPYVPGNIFSRINSKDFDGAIALLQSGNAHVNDTESRHGISVLGAALRHPALSPGFIQFIEFLLQKQADPHIPNDEGESAWHFAARLMLPNTPTTIASTELQSQLHRLFPNPDWDIFQFTHVHKVIAGLRPLNLKKVLENPIYHSQINAMDSLGQTPLGLAASLGDHRAVETLLLAGADVNPPLQSAASLHPLRSAIKSQRSRCVELLLMASANPFSLDGRRATLLHTAAAGCDSLSLIRPLLSRGIPLDSRNTHDCTPLSFTPLNDNYKVARFFLSQGANINNVDKDGDTPLTEAIRLNAHNCLRLFLDEGANMRTRNHRGWTVLHFAAAYSDIESIQILASSCLRGLNVQARNIQGNMPRDCLFERQHVPHGVLEAFESLLKSATPETTPLAVHYGAQCPTKPSLSEANSEETQMENNAFRYKNSSSSARLFIAPYIWLAWITVLAWTFLFLFH
jgi:ankyrin repeat protein